MRKRKKILKTAISKINPINFGRDIDTSKVQHSTNVGRYGYTNFFILGDSLSDVDGLTNLLKSKLSNPFINVDVKLNGEYGFIEDEEKHYCFSNGPTAGYLLNQLLGFEKIQSYSWNEQNNNYGRNYAVGGATAGELQTNNGSFLNLASILNQTKLLLSHHDIKETDLVFFEIGGNDLFEIIRQVKAKEDYSSFFKNSIDNIRESLFTLLNNGVNNIIFMTPPAMNQVPVYRNEFDEENAPISLLGEEIIEISITYYNALQTILFDLNHYFSKKVIVFDLYKELINIQEKWTKENKTLNKIFTKVGYSTKNEAFVEVDGEIIIPEIFLDMTIMSSLKTVGTKLIKYFSRKKDKTALLKINATTDKMRQNDGTKIEQYFFIDFVHPTKYVHKLVAYHLLKIAKKQAKIAKKERRKVRK